MGRKSMETLKIKTTSNKEHERRVRKALEMRDGFCPCSLLRDANIKCMCNTFREQTQPGPCLCGLYEKYYEE